jgi:hypothetical protein
MNEMRMNEMRMNEMRMNEMRMNRSTDNQSCPSIIGRRGATRDTVEREQKDEVKDNEPCNSLCICARDEFVRNIDLRFNPTMIKQRNQSQLNNQP